MLHRFFLKVVHLSLNVVLRFVDKTKLEAHVAHDRLVAWSFRVLVDWLFGVREWVFGRVDCCEVGCCVVFVLLCFVLFVLFYGCVGPFGGLLADQVSHRLAFMRVSFCGVCRHCHRGNSFAQIG